MNHCCSGLYPEAASGGITYERSEGLHQLAEAIEDIRNLDVPKDPSQEVQMLLDMRQG